RGRLSSQYRCKTVSLAFSNQVDASLTRKGWIKVPIDHVCDFLSRRFSLHKLISTGENLDFTCAVKRRWSTAGESPARELGSLHPEAIGAAVEETKPSEPPV